jgi:hypothetical protein
VDATRQLVKGQIDVCGMSSCSSVKGQRSGQINNETTAESGRRRGHASAGTAGALGDIWAAAWGLAAAAGVVEVVAVGVVGGSGGKRNEVSACNSVTCAHEWREEMRQRPRCPKYAARRRMGPLLEGVFGPKVPHLVVLWGMPQNGGAVRDSLTEFL